jgi:hypothetical protein
MGLLSYSGTEVTGVSGIAAPLKIDMTSWEGIWSIKIAFVSRTEELRGTTNFHYLCGLIIKLSIVAEPGGHSLQSSN